MQQNTALIDDIMAALDAESSQNVELIVRNTQNGATKKMALASLEQIIYSYLTTAPVVTNLASVLGVPASFYKNYNDIKGLGLGLSKDGYTALTQMASLQQNQSITVVTSDYEMKDRFVVFESEINGYCALVQLRYGNAAVVYQTVDNMYTFSVASGSDTLTITVTHNPVRTPTLSYKPL